MAVPGITWLNGDPAVETITVTIPASTVYAVVFILSGSGGTASAVTLDGSSCTNRGSSAGTTNGRASMWDIVSPSTGSVDIVATGADYTTNIFVACLTDVDTSDPRLATGTNSAGGDTVTVALSPASVDRLTFGASWIFNPNGPHVEAGNAATFAIELTNGDGDDIVAGVTSGGDEWGVDSTGGTTFADMCAISVRGSSSAVSSPERGATRGATRGAMRGMAA